MSKLKIAIVLAAVILTSFITFVSCSNDEENQITQNEQTTSENLKEFAEEYVKNSPTIRKEILKNKKIDKTLLNNLLSNCKNKNDLEIALKKAGINNYIEVSNLLIETAVSAINFMKNNPSLNKLTTNEKGSLITQEIFNVFDKIAFEKNNKLKLSNGKLAARTCIQQYNIDDRRCNRDSAVCYGTVIAASWAAGPF